MTNKNPFLGFSGFLFVAFLPALQNGKRLRRRPKTRWRNYVEDLAWSRLFFYLYIYPPDSQESDGGANT